MTVRNTDVLDSDEERTAPAQRRPYRLGGDHQGAPPVRKWVLPLAGCVGTFTLLMGVTAHGIDAPDRTLDPLPSFCHLRHAVETYEPAPAPLLKTPGTPAARWSCGATAIVRTPAPAPGPTPW
jgi:hypothetical protein